MIYKLLMIIIAYFLGDLNPAILVSRAKGEDIREKGSGNAGSTNVLRNYGAALAIATLAVDILKGVAAVTMGAAYGVEYFCAVAVLCGHVWPALFGFKGGKGVATFLGAALATDWRIALIALGIALIIMAVTKYVSLGSVIGAASAVLLSLYFKPDFAIFALILALIVIIKHRANIKRLFSGTESKLSFSKNKTSQEKDIQGSAEE